MDIGEKLFELRKDKNMTQDYVAEKLNVSRQSVSKWETNQSTPDFDKIVPLCELYEISPNELLMNDKQESVSNENSGNGKINKFLAWGKGKEINYENMTRTQIKQKSAEVVSSSILIFFIAVAFTGVGISVMGWNPIVVGCTFLMLVGYGVIKIVKHYMSISKFKKTIEEEKEDKIVKQINNTIESVGVIIYFIVSFMTMAWHITWIIFLIIGLIEQIVKLIFLLKEENQDEK